MNQRLKRLWLISLRWIGAVLIGYAVFRYLSLIIFEGLSPENRLTLVELGIIVLTVIGMTLLIRPDLLGLVKLIEVAGIRLELERLQQKQKQQENELATMKVMLPLLLPADERAHLKNLAKGKTEKYYGNGGLRQTIRRLRSAGLLRMKNGHHVSEFEDGKQFNLANFVELTADGLMWLEKIKAVEKEQHEDTE